MTIELVETTPDDGWFAGWCDVWASAQLADRPDEPPRPAQDHIALAAQLLGPGGSRDGAHRALVDGGDVLGALRVIVPTQDNPTVAILDVAVRPGARRRGYGTRLLQEGLRVGAAAGRSAFLAEIDEPDPATAGPAFAVRHGWTCDLVETRRDLVLPVDDHRLAEVERAARGDAGDYRVVQWRDHVPDELVEDRALLERRMTTDAPHGDLPVEEEHWDAARIREYENMHIARGRTVLSAGAVSRKGRLVAFTDLQVPLADPTRAHQGATLVLREHRGRRLGALIKAAVLRRVAEELPAVRRISTYNYDGNEPMVAVNEALGFLPAGHLSTWSRRG